jgi:hypothetical protein
MNTITEAAVTIFLAIIGIAALALLLNKNGTGIGFAQTLFSGVGNDIAVAGAPVTGQSFSVSLAYPNDMSSTFGS